MLGIIEAEVRTVMRQVARLLNFLSAGRLSPNLVTILGLVGYIPVVWLVAKGYHGYAAAGIIVFGLFDTLDGELARLQKRNSPTGMLLDSVTDRIKEIAIYIGLAEFVNSSFQKLDGVTYLLPSLIVAALGVSLLISYLNAWGEAVLARHNKQADKINATLRGGLMPYQLRIALLAIGLGFGEIWIALVIIVFMGSITCLQRFMKIIRLLKTDDQD